MAGNVRRLNYRWRYIIPAMIAGLGLSVYVGIYHPRPDSNLAPWLWFAQGMLAMLFAGLSARETVQNYRAVTRGGDEDEGAVYTRAHLRNDVLTVLGFIVWSILGLVAITQTPATWYVKFATTSLLYVEFLFMLNYAMNVTLRRRMRLAKERAKG